MIVLDTNVLSEALRPQPDASVMSWMRSQPISRLFTTSITEGELLYGAALLPDGKRRKALEMVLSQLLQHSFRRSHPAF